MKSLGIKKRVKKFLRRKAVRFGYNNQHLSRTVCYRNVEAFLADLDYQRLTCLEISGGWHWRKKPWRSYTNVSYPSFDICAESLERTFDIVIADNVFEHLKYPGRAARNVREMLKQGGVAIIITPFLIRQHAYPIDCTRWTADGLKFFLQENGFSDDEIHTASWGNKKAVKANLDRWARTGWQKNLPNDPKYPVTVWAFARKI